MVDVKCNFRGKYYDLNCRFKCNEEETQQHMFNCSVILNKLELSSASAEYNDLFRSVKHQKRAIEYFEKVAEILTRTDIGS